VFFEGSVVWDVFLWMLQRVCARVPVVSDTPLDHEWNPSMFRAAAGAFTGPLVEVALHGDADVLLRRAQQRAASGQVHEVKDRFSARSRDYYAAAYQPVLAERQIVRVDTTDPDAVDIPDVASRVRERLEAG